MPSELTPADVPDMLALSVEAGWNQTADDWAVFARHGLVFGERDGARIVATAAALPYGPFGFIGMVLTTREHRGRGFATRLTALAIEALRPAVSVLDATPAGEPVYARLGFRPLFQIQRLLLPTPTRAEAWDGAARHPGARPMGEGEAAFGADRAFLLDDFARRPGTAGIVRAGRVADHIGPLTARSEAEAIAILEATPLPRAAIIDVPTRWSRLAAWLVARGFAVQRAFTRMALGRDTPFGDPALLFATAGPEFG